MVDRTEPVPRTNESPGARILRTWQRLHAIPGGAWIFARFIWRLVPYTGALRPRVLELHPGYARVELRDRRGIRNHLNSIHAVALANLGEFTSGVAMLTCLPPTVRGIVTKISVEYVRKARGTMMAESHADAPTVSGETEQVARAVIKDSDGNVVATIAATWLLRPENEGTGPE